MPPSHTKQFALLATSLAAVVCAAGPTAPADAPDAGPVAGIVALNLSASADDVGALVLSNQGPASGAIRPGASGAEVFAEPVGESAGERRVAVVGDRLSGVVWITVPDVRLAASYQATVQEVARRDNKVRSEPGAYALRVTSSTE